MTDSGMNWEEAELLAPAGSVEAMHAALEAGADAVYIGGDRFGARAYADNPDREELLEAIRLTHRLGKKLYLTVNTLMKEDELEKELLPWIRPYAESGLDGVIIQDFGAVSMLREAFPDLPLHASTQMTVTGAWGAAFLKKQGLVRVVPARELSLQEIRTIYDRTHLEIEAFVHGAMCYSYSGQCLMSSMIGGRSGNRGRCAGVCRLPFDVFSEKNKLNHADERYPLNLKDMCAVDILPDMLAAGIVSFKIEGRMKKPAYTYGVVSVYRRYMDMAKECLASGRKEEYHVAKEDHQYLWDLFNRDGFSTGCFLEHNGRSMVAIHNEKLSDVRQQRAQKLTEEIRSELQSREVSQKLQAGIRGELTLSQADGAVLSCRWEDGRGRHASYTCRLEGVQKAEKIPATEMIVRKQIERTGGSPFYFLSLDVHMEDHLFIPVKVLNTLRRNAFQGLSLEIDRQFARNEREVSACPSEEAESHTIEKDVVRAVPVWFSCRTEAQLRALGSMPDARRIYLTVPQWERWKEFDKKKTTGILRLELPWIMRAVDEKRIRAAVLSYMKTCGEQPGAGILVKNLEEFGLLCSMGYSHMAIADAGFYTWNSRAIRFFIRTGLTRFTAPWELNAGELSDRNGGEMEMIVYGRTPMMISTHCLKKTLNRCDHADTRVYLADRKSKKFPVESVCDFCYNVIYNSLPASLLTDAGAVRKLHPASVRVSFTTEDGGDTAKIAAAFLAAYEEIHVEQAEDFRLTDTTRGHFRRGVE